MPFAQVLQRAAELESVLKLIFAANSRPTESLDAASETGIHVDMPARKKAKTKSPPDVAGAGSGVVGMASTLAPALQV
jgi:hypothetical protein